MTGQSNNCSGSNETIKVRFHSLWPSDAIWWQRSRSTSAQVMDCRLMEPMHDPDLYWLIIIDVLLHSPEGSFAGNAREIYPWYGFENYYFNITTASDANKQMVRGIHRSPVNSPHKGPVTRKMFPFDDVIMTFRVSLWETVTQVFPRFRSQSFATRAICAHTHIARNVNFLLFSGVPDLWGRTKILRCGDLSHLHAPDCIWVFFYFVWFLLIHHNIHLYFELSTYCNILDIYLL